MSRASHANVRVTLAALGAVTVLLVTPASTAEPRSGVLTVELSNLRSNSGQAACEIFRSAKGFPTDASAALQHRWCPIVNKASSCAFDPIPAGTYAVACFHDENNNGKLDFNLLGIPTEDTVASNYAKGVMGPPSFKDAAFAFSGVASVLRLQMRH